MATMLMRWEPKFTGSWSGTAGRRLAVATCQKIGISTNQPWHISRRMLTKLDDEFWDDLLIRIKEGEVIPVVGPGAVTFGGSDELLYPWLAQKLAAEIEPRLYFETPPRDLHEIVHAQRHAGQPADRIYRKLNGILSESVLRPGSTLAALAGIEGFRLFLSTTFDPLLGRAVQSVSPGGKDEERLGAANSEGGSPDLPMEVHKLPQPFVYQIMGQVQPARRFVVWDDDALHFLLALNRQLEGLTRLDVALKTHNLLILGTNYPDWLLRFFMHVMKRKRLADLDEENNLLFIAETIDAARQDQVVIYFDRVTRTSRILPADPRAFIKDLYDQWRRRYPAPVGDPYLQKKAAREKHRAPGCLFISYASPDLEIARYIVTQLQRAGILVWFDKQQLVDGQDWKHEFTDAIQNRCGLFLSIISKHTATRVDAYNIYERNEAGERRKTFAQNAIFYLALRIDDGEPLVPPNEPFGTETIQARRQLGGHLEPDFIAFLREKQREYCTAKGLPLPPDPE